MPDQLGDGDYVEDDLDGVSGLPDGLALFRKNLDEPLADICRLLGPKQFLATVRKKIPWGVGSIMSPLYIFVYFIGLLQAVSGFKCFFFNMPVKGNISKTWLSMCFSLPSSVLWCPT